MITVTPSLASSIGATRALLKDPYSVQSRAVAEIMPRAYEMIRRYLAWLDRV